MRKINHYEERFATRLQTFPKHASAMDHAIVLFQRKSH